MEDVRVLRVGDSLSVSVLTPGTLEIKVAAIYGSTVVTDKRVILTWSFQADDFKQVVKVPE